MTDTTAKPAAPETLTVTVDGKAVTAAPGELVIEVAERAGVYIPRFCYHPHMEPVGMCRMCLVEVSGPRGFSLQPSCYVRVADGQEVRTDSPKARKAQEGVLEFLLVNHPLDCPVCDKGGECPLQDQALSHGPGESRFVEEKRHWEKPISIGPLVHLDRERCIQCARCTRFASEIAGEALIDFAFRGDQIEVATFPERPFSSYFSGNTVQICPVGALTAAPYRFKSRPWDLEQVESTCTACSVGCRIVAQSSAGRLVRYLGIDSEPVNQTWLCDKGRFSYEAAYAANRLTRPQIRRDGELVDARWAEALRDAAKAIHDANLRLGPGGVAFLGGARLTNEDAYAWAKLAKGILHTDHVDAQLGDGLPSEVVLGLPRATIDEVTRARAVIVLAPDLREELPVLYLRLRAAARAGVPIIECAPAPTALAEVASAQCRYAPGEEARLVGALFDESTDTDGLGTDPAALEAARALLGAAAAEGEASGGGIVVVLGRPSLADDGRAVTAAAALFHRMLPGARFLPVLRRANVHGALDMGLTPGMLPGRVTLDAGREWFEAAWDGLPADAGRDARAILEAAAAGELGVLVLLGADPLADFPDPLLARTALEQVDTLIALGTHADASNQLARIVLPVAGSDERWGSTTNCEGRVTRVAAKIVPPGTAWPAWSVAVELAHALDADLGFDSVEELSREIARLAPAHRGVDLELLGRPERRDGVVLPLEETPVTVLGSVAGGRGPRPLDPMATPGISSVEEQGAPLFTGLATPPGGSGGRIAPPTVARPGLLQLSGLEAAGLAASAPPRRDAYSFRLVLRRSLYDRGTLVQAAPSLAGLAPEPVLTVHPSALDKLGVPAGGRLRMRAPRGDLELVVAADASIAPGVVVLSTNLLPEGPAALVDTAQPVTDVRLETIS